MRTTKRPVCLRLTCGCRSGTTIILDGALACARCAAPLSVDTDGGAERPFSQRDGERPSGCSRARYLRVWRAAARAGDAGATSDGRARLLTRSTYDCWRRRLAEAAAKKRAEPEGDSTLAALMGLGARS